MAKKKAKAKQKPPAPVRPAGADDGAECPSADAVYACAQGKMHVAAGAYSASVLALTKAISHSAQQSGMLAQLFTARSLVFYRIKDYGNCIRDCTHAITLNPQLTRALVRRAAAYVNRNQPQLALQDYEAAAALPFKYSTRLADVAKKVKAASDSAAGADYPTALQLEQAGGDSDLELTDAEASSTGGYDDLDDGASLSDSDDELPPLILAGQEPDESDADVDPRTAKARNDSAMREKELGNQSFAEGHFERSLAHYTAAINLNKREAVFFSNRAAVYLKMHRYHDAIFDCTKAIERKPAIKAYARRAAAWASLEEYVLAAEDYRRALNFEPRNQDCLNQLEKCLVRIEAQCARISALSPDDNRLRRALRRARRDLGIE